MAGVSLSPDYKKRNTNVRHVEETQLVLDHQELVCGKVHGGESVKREYTQLAAVEVLPGPEQSDPYKALVFVTG